MSLFSKCRKKCTQDHFSTYVRDYQFKKAPPEAKMPECNWTNNEKRIFCIYYTKNIHQMVDALTILMSPNSHSHCALLCCVCWSCNGSDRHQPQHKKAWNVLRVSASFMAMCKRKFSSLFFHIAFRWSQSSTHSTHARTNTACLSKSLRHSISFHWR